MPAMRRGILIRISIIAIAVVASGSYVLTRQNDLHAASIAALERCTVADQPVSCAQPIIVKLLDAASEADIVRAIESAVDGGSCHYLSHIVGQQAVQKTGDLEGVLARCPQTCESACVHGAVSQAFAQELGVTDPSFELGHLDLADIRKSGTKLCATSQPCHAVGHVLFQSFAKYAPALDECDAIAPEQFRMFCYGGVFMEYADVLDARSLNPTTVSATLRSRDLHALCTSQTNIERERACFLYFPRIAWRVWGGSKPDAVARIIDVCKAYPEADRHACFSGLGAFSSFTVSTDIHAALAACAVSDDPRDIAACNLGTINLEIVSSQLNILSYCARQSSEALRRHCFEAVFYKLDQRGDAIQPESDAFCKTDALCREAMQHYGDPWDALTTLE